MSESPILVLASELDSLPLQVTEGSWENADCRSFSDFRREPPPLENYSGIVVCWPSDPDDDFWDVVATLDRFARHPTPPHMIRSVLRPPAQTAQVQFVSDGFDYTTSDWGRILPMVLRLISRPAPPASVGENATRQLQQSVSLFIRWVAMRVDQWKDPKTDDKQIVSPLNQHLQSIKLRLEVACYSEPSSWTQATNFVEVFSLACLTVSLPCLSGRRDADEKERVARWRNEVARWRQEQESEPGWEVALNDGLLLAVLVALFDVWLGAKLLPVEASQKADGWVALAVPLNQQRWKAHLEAADVEKQPSPWASLNSLLDQTGVVREDAPSGFHLLFPPAKRSVVS